jgi:hypothetical protein
LRQWQERLIIVTSSVVVNGRPANPAADEVGPATIRTHIEQNLCSCTRWYAEKNMLLDAMFPDFAQLLFCDKCLLLMTL